MLVVVLEKRNILGLTSDEDHEIVAELRGILVGPGLGEEFGEVLVVGRHARADRLALQGGVVVQVVADDHSLLQLKSEEQ